MFETGLGGASPRDNKSSFNEISGAFDRRLTELLIEDAFAGQILNQDSSTQRCDDTAVHR